MAKGKYEICGGKYGVYGGQYVPEMMMGAINDVEKAYERYKDDPEFRAEFNALMRDYVGRPSPLTYAGKMTEDLGGAKIYLKREDLNHTGAHKINNVIGQVLLARKMGKKRLICETGAGQHGVATATAAALFGMECDVYMGAEDMKRQALNVYRMELLGTKVHAANSGTQTLKDAVNEALCEWATRIEDTFYVIGSAVGPHPYPEIVRDFQSVISKESRQQILEKEGRLPNAVVACIGGGSNAIGAFNEYLEDEEVRLYAAEGIGQGIGIEMPGNSIGSGSPGIYQGTKSYYIQSEYGQLGPVHSIAAGLDHPGVGPIHAYLNDIGRVTYVPITDDEAVNAFEYIARQEGIICAIESAHGVAYAMKLAPTMSKDEIMIINLSGRGDKDVAAIARYRGVDLHE